VRLRAFLVTTCLGLACSAPSALCAEPVSLGAGVASPLHTATSARRGSHVTWARPSSAKRERELVGRDFGSVLPDWVRSVRVLAEGEPLFAAPQAGAKRRGAAALGARLPVYSVKSASGCAGAWLQVGPEAWLCESGGELGTEAPLAADARLSPPPSGLPHGYYFVGELGSFGYRELARAELGTPDVQLEPGFAVALLQKDAPAAGDPFGLTSHGLWVPLRDVRPASPSTFEGATLEPGQSLAWTVENDTPVRSAPGGSVTVRLARQSVLQVLERRVQGGKAWLRVGDARFVEERKVSVMRPAPLPRGLTQENERWLDVDLHEQVLTAYEGRRPVFATLVSTGRGTGSSEEATPLGEHRLWVKLVASDMDNLENEEAERYYSMQAVPWVMYFEGGYGLHGVFWHGDFGRRRSHGCVNLSPRDAAQLFSWTSPRLPAGWSAVLPTRYEPGTLVRVRDSSASGDPGNVSQ
jgi:hypothetical protein